MLTLILHIKISFHKSGKSGKKFNENIVKTLKRLYNHIEEHYERNKIERIDVLNDLVKEIDFVCNLGNKGYYVQSALNLETREKTIQEEKTLMNINDNFKKIIVVKDNIKH